jgi:hypothetical protein
MRVLISSFPFSSSLFFLGFESSSSSSYKFAWENWVVSLLSSGWLLSPSVGTTYPRSPWDALPLENTWFPASSGIPNSSLAAFGRLNDLIIFSKWFLNLVAGFPGLVKLISLLFLMTLI